MFCRLLVQLFQHICQNLIALLELCNGGHDIFIGTLLASIFQLLCQVSQFGGMGGVVVDHVVHQRTQLCERCATVFMVVMMVMAMLMGMVMVLVVMVVVVTMQMLMGMGMFMVVRVTVFMLVAVRLAIMGMLVGMAVDMLMAMHAIVIVFVTHSNQNSFSIVT